MLCGRAIEHITSYVLSSKSGRDSYAGLMEVAVIEDARISNNRVRISSFKEFVCNFFSNLSDLYPLN